VRPVLSPWIVVLLALCGCQSPGELRLRLVGVEPDPLEGVESLRLRFFDGAEERVVELPFDGQGELSDGVRGEVVVDLSVEALSGRGGVVARGRLAGDITPPAGEVVEESMALLRAGAFSRVDGLELDDVGLDPCLIPLPDGRLLLAGGGRTDAWLLDVDRGLLTPAADGLALTDGPCQGAALTDGRVAVHCADGEELVIVHGDGYGGHEAVATGRGRGAQAPLRGGELVWFMGGESDGDSLTSELLIAGEDGVVEGPRVEGLTLAGHRLACAAGGEACAALGGAEAEPSWWRVAASDVADAAGGYALDPLVHDGDQPDLPGRTAVPFDDSHVIGLLEDDDVWLGLYDVRDDGALVWSRGQPAGLTSAAAAAAGTGRAYLVGGHDGDTATAGLWSLSPADGTFLFAPVDGVALAHPRQRPGAVMLADGRLVVAGGIESGQAVAPIEIYEPLDASLP